MRMEEIRSIAKSQGVATAKLAKAEMIRMIQAEEGNYACFGTAFDGVCDQANCLWQTDCFKTAPKGELS